MKLLIIQILVLVLMEGSQSLDCKVCDEGTIDGSPIGSGSLIGDNVCSPQEADNLETCEVGNDVCVTYTTYYEFIHPSSKMTQVVKAKSYLCGVEADLEYGSNSAFCGQDQEDSGAAVKAEQGDGVPIQNFVCDVTEPAAKEVTEEEDDCRKKVCNAAEAPQTKLGFVLVCAAPVLYGLI